MKRPTPFQNDHGAALIISLMFVAILAMIGTTAVVMTTTDMQIGGNYRASTEAFFDADAGINYAIRKLEDLLKAGNFPSESTWDNLEEMAIGDSASLNLSAFNTPTGFNFSYAPSVAPVLIKVADNKYYFTTIAAGNINSTATIGAVCRQRPGITMAAFGDKKLDVKGGAKIHSYNSSSSDPNVNNPAVATTHNGDIGSNDWLLTGSSSWIDGSGVLGEKLDGSDATNSISDPSYNFYGPTPLDQERVDPDPLGVDDGLEYDPDTYVSSNDNSLAVGLVGDTIAGGTSATLYGGPSGTTANYYLDSITVKNGDTLTIDTSGGRGAVHVFVKGKIEFQTGSKVVYNPSSFNTKNFAIFSDSTDKVSIKNSAKFIGLIYAPFSTNVDIMNGGDFYGAVWGESVELKNVGEVFYDDSLSDKYLSKAIELTSWENIRN